ncbi:unnamed protein product [Prunus brigantina]
MCETEKGAGLAGRRSIAIRVSSGGGGYNKKKIKGRKKVKVIKERLMDFWHKMIFPVRRVWLTVSARIKARKNAGAGLLKLHDDVQTCGYQDVQVMWQMLSRDTELTSHHSKRKQRPFWRVFEFSSNNSKPSPLSSNHA